MAVTKERKSEIIKEFQRKEQDTGSSEVQVAILSENIKAITEHLSLNKKDFGARRGLLRMVGQRRRLLRYIKRKDPLSYNSIIKRLGLKR